jgi:tRNA A-37 threonylcarbamoyl transferase component Bud32
MTSRDGTKNRGADHHPAGGERTSGANYRELLPIASGGSANISIAISEGVAGFSKLVVLKTIREELIANAGATKMFLDEARLSARLNHPNVVQVYEVFLRKEVPVIVMEFLDGQPLSYILAQTYDNESLTLDLAISILSKVLAGLHYAHTLSDFSGEPLGLIHRDVSPHNVMVTYDGQVKLVDFGIAKLAGLEHQTRTGVIKGKLTYMAPEQFTGRADSRADIFGVGVMLWEVATRQRFWGDLPEPTLIGRLIAGDLPHLHKPYTLDEDLYRICCGALAFRPEDRYESAAALQEELERYLAKRGAVVTQASIGRLVTETCAEARRKVQVGIREQLTRHGLSLTGTGDGLVGERIRAKDGTAATRSGERMRPKPGSREASSGGFGVKGGEPSSSGGLRSKAGDPTTGFQTSVMEPTTTGGLRRKFGTEQTTTGGLRSGTRSGSSAPGSAGSSADAAPLRLFGGVAPTARIGVALAGFGTLAVLILALGLATPDDRAEAAPSSSKAASAPPTEVHKPRSVRITASAEPRAASWYLDDQKLDTNPLEISMPTDGAVHTLRAEAPGFKPFIKSVRLEADIDITVILTQE